MLHKKLTGKIINSFYRVYNSLGYGFLEKVYENALVTELQKQDLTCTSQFPIKVFYEETVVGEFYADVIVNNKVILELKACKNISEAPTTQLLNYLQATNIQVGLLLNFGKRPQFRRRIFTNK